MNEIILSAARKCFPENFDVLFYLESLVKNNSENTWFRPNNSDGENYTRCRELATVGLICERKIPHWHNGSFRGFIYEFYYNLNLEYKFQ